MIFFNLFSDCKKQDSSAFIVGSVRCDFRPIEMEKAPVLDPTWRDSIRSVTSSPTSVSALFEKVPAQILPRSCEYLYTVLRLYDKFGFCFDNYTVEAMLIFISNYEHILDNSKTTKNTIVGILNKIEEEVNQDITQTLSKQQSEDLLLRALLDISDAVHTRKGTEKSTYHQKKVFNAFFKENKFKLSPQYRDGLEVQKLFKKFSTEIDTLPLSVSCKKTLPFDLFRLEYFADTQFYVDGYPIEFNSYNRFPYNPILTRKGL